MENYMEEIIDKQADNQLATLYIRQLFKENEESKQEIYNNMREVTIKI